MDQTIHHRCGIISLEKDIYRFDIAEGAEITLEDAEELIRIGTEMTKGLRVGALVDARANFTDTNESRKYFAEQTAAQQFAAVAVVTKSLAQRLIVNFYINVNRPNVPTRMFGDKEEAIKWLRKTLD